MRSITGFDGAADGAADGVREEVDAGEAENSKTSSAARNK